jgi:hypothetical protein
MMLFQFGVSHDFKAKQEAIQYCSQHTKSVIHCSMFRQLQSHMALEVVDRSVRSGDGSHRDSM